MKPSTPDRPGERLRAALRRDSKRVRPLWSAQRRALVVALVLGWVVTFAVFSWPGVSLVVPLESFPGGGVSAILASLGVALLVLALREGVPGAGLGGARSAGAIGCAIALQVVTGLLLWHGGGRATAADDGVAAGLHCASVEGWIATPFLVVAIGLLMRAFPVRPAASGALAGAAAALLADAIWHLACARVDLAHLLQWHAGVTVAAALAGAVVGRVAAAFYHRG